MLITNVSLEFIQLHYTEIILKTDLWQSQR